MKIFKILKNHKLERYSKESGLVTGADSIFQHLNLNFHHPIRARENLEFSLAVDKSTLFC